MPLAESLVKDRYIVLGSTTSQSKIKSLKESGIIPSLINLNPDYDGDYSSDFFNSVILIMNIPPTLKDYIPDYHLIQIKSILDKIFAGRTRKIIFISSTSVYGSGNIEYNETSETIPESRNGLELVKIEESLKTISELKVTIIRFGGLIGKDRDPVKYFAGKTDLSGGNNPVNLIHLDDCIGIIKAVVSQNCWNETFNGVCPGHPTRKEYYSRSAEFRGLIKPSFKEESVVNWKIVNSQNLTLKLNYKLLYQHPFDWLR